MASLISSSARPGRDIPQAPLTESAAQEGLKARATLHQLVQEYLVAQIALGPDLRSYSKLSKERIKHFNQKEKAIVDFLDKHHAHIPLNQQETIRQSMKDLKKLIRKFYGVQLDRLVKTSEEKKKAQGSK